MGDFSFSLGKRIKNCGRSPITRMLRSVFEELTVGNNNKSREGKVSVKESMYLKPFTRKAVRAEISFSTVFYSYFKIWLSQGVRESYRNLKL